MSQTIYWESRNQSIAGQVAVAQVTLNRVIDERYPNNICDVVYQYKQFSWYWDGKPDTPYNEQAWEQAQFVADAVISGSGHIELRGVTHYHSILIQPYWLDEMEFVAQIDDHIFYRIM